MGHFFGQLLLSLILLPSAASMVAVSKCGEAAEPCGSHGACDEADGTCICAKGFTGLVCQLCEAGHFGANCEACNCTENAVCNQGRHGDGSCSCKEGWFGHGCETEQRSAAKCAPDCHPQADCLKNNTCVCKPLYEGNGLVCTEIDRCKHSNGGCYREGSCRMKEGQVICTCPIHYEGDGYDCNPINPCKKEDYGGCPEHSVCINTLPGKSKCMCKPNYVENGDKCELNKMVDRCLTGNGQCHHNANCTDLHFEDKTAGVYHDRNGRYTLNYTEARRTCTAKGATLATYKQLSNAQKAGMHVCAAGWIEGARVAFPLQYSHPMCGRAGIADWGFKTNLDERYDVYCYRVKDVQCACKQGYIGDGYNCTGNLLQVLRSQPRFSHFLAQVLNFSQSSPDGKGYVDRLSNITLQSTLFAIDNNGLPSNQALSSRDLELHLSEAQALSLQELTNSSHISTRLGETLAIRVTHLNDSLKTISSLHIGDSLLVESNIFASNGIIHVLQKPLTAPLPKPLPQISHPSRKSVEVTLSLLLVAGVMFVGNYFFRHKLNHIYFHYFKRNGQGRAPPLTVSNTHYVNM